MPAEQPTNAPRPDYLRRLEIDSYRASAQDSLVWNDKLKNPGRLKRVGRQLMNSVGVLSPEQKAIQHHDGIIANYADSVRVQPDQVGAMSEGEHIQAREQAIGEEIAEGHVVIEPKPNAEITSVGSVSSTGVRQLGLRH